MNKAKLEIVRLNNEDVIATSCNKTTNHYKIITDKDELTSEMKLLVYNSETKMWELSGSGFDVEKSKIESPSNDLFYVRVGENYVVCDDEHYW